MYCDEIDIFSESIPSAIKQGIGAYIYLEFGRNIWRVLGATECIIGPGSNMAVEMVLRRKDSIRNSWLLSLLSFHSAHHRRTANGSRTHMKNDLCSNALLCHFPSNTFGIT